MPKIIKIFIALVLLGWGIAAAYFYLYLPTQEEEVVAGVPTMSKLADPEVISPVNSFSNNSLWYGISNGRIMQYDLNANNATEYPLPPVVGSNFKKIYWPRLGNDFIAVSDFEGDDQFSYFNFKDKRYYLLPKNIANLDWHNSNAKIVIIWRSGDGKTYLVISNPDASGYKILRELPWPDMVVKASPTNDSALLFRGNSPDPVNKIYTFDLATGEYVESVNDGRNTGVVWSPNGSGFAFTRLENGQNKVFYHQFTTGINSDLKLSTSIDKLAFSQDGRKIYIAAPSQDGEREDLWEYTIETKELVTLHSSDEIRAKNLIPIGRELFFLNQENALYGLR